MKKRVKKVCGWVLLGERNRPITIERAFGKKPPDHYAIGTWAFYTDGRDKWVPCTITYTLPPNDK